MLNQNLYAVDDSLSLTFNQDQGLELGAASANRGLHRRSGDVETVVPRQGRPAKLRPPAIPKPKAIDPEKVLKSFNTWAFKREQPSDAQLLLRTVARSVTRSEAIPFVMYWGKGPRCKIDTPDIECLDHLAVFSQRIRAAYEGGAAIKLILTDTHARLNGHAAHAIDSYFAEVDAAARERGFETCWLGQLTQAPGLRTEIDPADEAFLTADVVARLAKSALKWYRGKGTAEDGARTYYRMNMVERRAVELAFPQAVFASFNGSSARWLFPESMPIFYMYSLRRGFSVKPWFLPEGGASCDAATCHCAPPTAPV
jgi:hypothetical protein